MIRTTIHQQRSLVSSLINRGIGDRTFIRQKIILRNFVERSLSTVTDPTTRNHPFQHQHHTTVRLPSVRYSSTQTSRDTTTTNGEDFDVSLYYPPTEDTKKSNQALNKTELLAQEEAKRQAIRDEIDSRTGRLWSDPYEITDDEWASGRIMDDLPDWNKEICSRVSKERVRLHPDGIPTMKTFASLPLPHSAPPHPAESNPKLYYRHRTNRNDRHVYDAVSVFAAPRIEPILAMEDWNDKQDAIDKLFEEVQEAVKKAVVKRSIQKGGRDGSYGGDDYVGNVLAFQPGFPLQVERALERFLRNTVEKEKKNCEGDGGDVTVPDDEADVDAMPVFFDFRKIKKLSSSSSSGKKDKPSTESTETTDFDGAVPRLLFPLKPHHKDGPGRMVEEWELAADKTTTRIMARLCMRDVVRPLLAASEDVNENGEGGGCRVYVRGEKGTGKTATLAAVVASARLSGHIVLYLPDGDRLMNHGIYVQPNDAREGMFDVPSLAMEICGQMLEIHGDDTEDMMVDAQKGGKLSEGLTKIQLRDLLKIFGGGDSGKGDKKAKEEVANPPSSVPLNDLLKFASENEEYASGIYSAAIHTLSNQTETPFTIVMDEFNCYFDKGDYFHMEYDKHVRRPIPANKITLFEPLLAAIGVEKDDYGVVRCVKPMPIRRGGIVVGTTKSRAVPRSAEEKLEGAIADGVEGSDSSDDGITVVDVPHFSAIEVDHVLANFEVIGIGRLRFDQGATVMDAQEVAYLKMVSGGVGQNLLDSCIC